MNKHIVSVSLITALAVFAIFGSTAAYAKTMLSSTLRTKYAAGNGAVFHDEPVIQSSIFHESQNGVFCSLWNSIGLDDSDPSSNFGDEIDWTVGWQGDVRGFGFEATLAYWDVVDLFSDKPADIVGVTLAVSKALMMGINSSLSVERYIPTDSSVFNGGHRITVGLSYTGKIDESMSAFVGQEVVWEDGVFGLDSGFNGKFSTSINWKVGRATIAFPTLTVYTTLSDFKDGRKDEFVAGSGISFTF